MNNLIKNELTKIFHKKSIFVVLIITIGFMVLNGVLDKIFLDEIIYNNNIEYLKEELKTLDKNKKSDKEEYISIRTQLELEELAQKYDKESWQRYIIHTNAYEILQQMIRSENTAEYATSKKIYDEFIEKLNNDNWKVFAEEELEEVNQEINDTNPESEQLLQTLKDRKQVLEWRIDRNITYGQTTLNEALQRWLSDKETLRDYAEQAKTKELTYNEKYEKQQTEANIKIYEYEIQNELNKNIKLTILNGQTALSSDNDGTLIQSINIYTIFVTIVIVIIAGTSVSEEFNKGTIKLLLVRPYKRIKILLAKFISCFIILFIVYIVVALAQTIIGGVFNGFDTYTGKEIIYNFKTNSVETIGTFKYLILSGLAILPQYILIMTLAFSLSIIFNNSALAIALPLMGTMTGSIINQLAYTYKQAEFLKFFVTPNWDFTIYLFGKMPRFEPISLPFSIFICLIYFIVMVVVSSRIFVKKEVKNV